MEIKIIKFIESLKAQSLQYYNQKMLMSMSSTKDWGEMLNFMEKNLNGIYSGIRKHSHDKNEIQKQIDVLKKEINELGVVKSKNYKEIIVNIETDKTGEIVLK